MADNPKLTVLFEELRGKTFELDKETMSVGRRDTNDICIPHGSLSGHHADMNMFDQQPFQYKDTKLSAKSADLGHLLQK